jgi:hypothetical protein
LWKCDVSHGSPVVAREFSYALMLRPVNDITVSPNNSDNEGCGMMNSEISSTVASQLTAK